jgi:ubiquinone/menaquinone biosynthesis C-methylase UbiE
MLTREFAEWVLVSCGRSLKVDRGVPWVLDAGCGSAEKASWLARIRPDVQVVGLDQSGSLAVSRSRYADLRNLHLIRGDVLQLPFSLGTFPLVMSIGVLHHTADTRLAFERLAEMVSSEGMLLTWIYPRPDEDPFWAALYRQRDIHFLGLASRLPHRLLFTLCHLHAMAMFLPMARLSYRYLKTHRFPFMPSRLSMWEFYKSQVFLSFDNLMPKYQFRHAAEEVVAWYHELGFPTVTMPYPAFFLGTRRDSGSG